LESFAIFGNRGFTITSRLTQLVLIVGVLAAASGLSLSDDIAAPAANSGVTDASEMEAELTRMLLERPSVPVTRPREAPPEAPKARPAAMPIVDRRCRIARRDDTGWYLLTPLDARPGERIQPRWILPSQLLGQIEAQLAQDLAATFRVSGEPTAYRDREFIFLASASVDRTDESVSADEPATEPVTATEQPKDTSSPDAIMHKLLRRRPGKRIAMPSDTDSVKPAESIAPAADGEQLDEDRGGMRIDRIVTIGPDADNEWWEARFISDNTLRDSPVRLLPCELLEQAERTAAAGRQRTVRLRITGEITQYKQRQYLLLRKVLHEHEMGQF
jgi:hypothetical protein